MKNKLLITGFIILIALSSIALAKDYPGIGVMTCGDLWESFMPSAINKYYSESKTDVTRCFVLMRSGNFERQWTTPTTMYPSGADFHMPWSQNFMMSEYSHEAINNYYTDADERNPFYANAFWLESMANAGGVSTNADQHGGVPWADAGRLSMVYEVAMPTNLGIDVKVRVRGFTLNEANMNDWLAMELELTNTGVQDVNCDGEIDRENHKIEALSLGMATEVIGSIRNNVKGNRRGAKWLKSRMIGYDATPDPDGNPWAIGFAWGSNNNPADIDADGWAPDENRYVGYRHGQAYPQDIFDGWQYIAVKQGGMEGGAAAADKKTIYDSHGIGEGTERGWYTTFNRTMASQRTGYANYLAATGTWYEDGGRTWQWDQLTNMKPDPNYFDQSGTFTAGGYPSSVPDAATLEYRIGLIPGEVNEAVFEEIKQVVERVSTGDTWLSEHPPKVELFGWWGKSNVISEDHPFTQAVARSYEKVMGQTPHFNGVTACGDIWRLEHIADCPSLTFGCTGERIHQNDEYMVIEDYYNLIGILAHTILDWCGHK